MGKVKDLLVVEQALDAIKEHFGEIKDELRRLAVFGDGQDDEGHLELYIENYSDFCDLEAQWWLDQAESVDTLGDAEYQDARTVLAEKLMDMLSDYESELCLEELNYLKEKGE